MVLASANAEWRVVGRQCDVCRTPHTTTQWNKYLRQRIRNPRRPRVHAVSPPMCMRRKVFVLTLRFKRIASSGFPPIFRYPLNASQYLVQFVKRPLLSSASSALCSGKMASKCTLRPRDILIFRHLRPNMTLS